MEATIFKRILGILQQLDVHAQQCALSKDIVIGTFLLIFSQFYPCRDMIRIEPSPPPHGAEFAVRSVFPHLAA